MKTALPGCVLFIAGALLASRTPCQAPASSTTPPPVGLVGGPIPDYSNQVQALKKLLADAFAAVQAGDSDKSSSYYASMVIPNHAQWFVEFFGPSEGAHLESKYSSLQSGNNDWIRQRFELAAKNHQTDPEVTVYQKLPGIRFAIPPLPADQRVLQGVFSAMFKPFPIYSVRLRSDSEADGSTSYLGEFVEVDGGFRYMEAQVWGAVSTIPPQPGRVRIAGNVQAPKRVNYVEPVYPEEARSAGIEGEIKLHVLVGIDGSVLQIDYVSGPRELVQAALDAVRQWRYQPTLLNAEPVEVDTVINVSFKLKK